MVVSAAYDLPSGSASDKPLEEPPVVRGGTCGPRMTLGGMRVWKVVM